MGVGQGVMRTMYVVLVFLQQISSLPLHFYSLFSCFFSHVRTLQRFHNIINFCIFQHFFHKAKCLEFLTGVHGYGYMWHVGVGARHLCQNVCV